MLAHRQFSGVTQPFSPGSPITVFPRASAQVAKEALAVIGLVLTAAVLAMLATFLAPELFARPAGPAVCATLDPWSLLSTWCSAAI